MQRNIVFSSAYLPPIQYFTKIISSESIIVEQHENFQKQTYRNRCIIAGANGTIPLIVPVEKGRGRKVKIKDLTIYNGMAWQRNHWRSIFSAYNSSPYFEYYNESLQRIYEKSWKFLLDFNMETTNWAMEELEISTIIKLSEGFLEDSSELESYREIISPKTKETDKAFNPAPYTQVFSEKFAFIPNLSIIDLLFNEGPNSFTILEKSNLKVR